MRSAAMHIRHVTTMDEVFAIMDAVHVKGVDFGSGFVFLDVLDWLACCFEIPQTSFQGSLLYKYCSWRVFASALVVTTVVVSNASLFSIDGLRSIPAFVFFSSPGRSRSTPSLQGPCFTTGGFLLG